MTTDRGELLAIQPDGTWRMVPCTYEGIKDGLNGATLDFIQFDTGLGAYIDDNGMIENQPLNVPASMVFARPLYGPVVLCSGEPDEEGDTLPLDPRYLLMPRDLGDRWAIVLMGAVRLGQDITVYPTADTIPPARVIQFQTEEEFQAYLERGEIPDGL